MNEHEESSPGPETGPETGVKFDINDIIGTAKAIITTPVGYFQSMAKTGGFVNPLIFVIVMSLIAGVISGILSFVGSPVGMLAYGLAGIIFIPIGATIGAFIGAGILFVIWKLMGSTENYEVSFRCVAAVSAIYPITAVLYLVPYLGTIATAAWSAFLLIEASVGVHGLKRRTAQIVFGIIAVVLIIMNVSAEHAARNLAGEAERLSEILEQYQD
jgi:hypothetical protein